MSNKFEEIQRKVRESNGPSPQSFFLSADDNVDKYVSVNVDVRKKKPKFEDTHRRKTFWIANDIADKIDEEIRSDRGAMTYLINALLSEYFAKRDQ